MGLRVKTNVTSLIAQRRLAVNMKEAQDSIEQLSSGYRINKSSDDPAGLALSDTLRTKIKSFAQAKRNVSDGISLLQTSEGGLNDISNILIRMRELTTQAASDTLDETQRSYLNSEFQELRKEAVRIKDQTEYNGRYVLADYKKDLQIQIGANFRYPNSKVNSDSEFISLKYEGVKDFNKSLDNLSDLSLEGINARYLGGSQPSDIFNAIDDSMLKVSGMRASIGGLQSRLNTTLNSIDVANENLNAAQSRIKDVDYAQETSTLAQNRILVSAGTSVLSQANQLPEHVLSLLKQ
jgi:flagellin